MSLLSSSANKILQSIQKMSCSYLFRQLFDKESSTYSYIIGDNVSREALLIDPVFEQAERDEVVIKEMDLNLKYVLNTHVHADHVTGSGRLKKMNSKVQSGISALSGASADIKLNHLDTVKIGNLELQVRCTPGHTNGCVAYVFHEGGMVFTGDTLLIRGCGRTDFQEGSSKLLYESVHTQLFTLPDFFTVYPAHDYKGNTCSTIGEEKKYNPRLTKNLEEFEQIMSNLNLAYPKMIDKAVPANKECGLFNLPEEFEQKLKMAQQTTSNATIKIIKLCR